MASFSNPGIMHQRHDDRIAQSEVFTPKRRPEIQINLSRLCNIPESGGKIFSYRVSGVDRIFELKIKLSFLSTWNRLIDKYFA